MQPIVDTIWREKYRHGDEEGPGVSKTRVAKAVCAGDPEPGFMEAVLGAMLTNEFCPGGRIHASAGTGLRSTMINCFVNDTIEDSMPGIMAANTRAALTMQTGGGIGQDFSTLRPKGAVVKGVGSVSSGPLSFMDVWNATCATILSGGSRRGAMMATMCDTHPDIFDFITAKRETGRLTNFNLSVLVSDALMKAVDADDQWYLGFDVPPADQEPFTLILNNGKPWYTYQVVKARDLWEAITRNSYDYSEPGVIFIDQVNKRNNLHYCEDIRATNPCGEQPLPPNGACNLGCVNLAVLVRNPFTKDAYFDFDRLKKVTQLGVRFLDNVLDRTSWPVPEQEAEGLAKRRIGLGIMGLGNALQMLGIRYGSKDSIAAAGAIMEAIKIAAYATSINLSAERGSFPAYDAAGFLSSWNVKDLPQYLQRLIEDHGIRNGCLLTIAPTGTTAIYYNNVSSGLEPSFAWRFNRKVDNHDGTFRDFSVLDAGWEAYCDVNSLDPLTAPTDSLPGYMATALELTVEDHLKMQAVCQKYVDASISKTINCPPDITYADYANVFRRAYELGCKGATTYRPNGTRGAVLTVDKPTKQPSTIVNTDHLTADQVQAFKDQWDADKGTLVLLPGIIAQEPSFLETLSPEEIEKLTTTFVAREIVSPLPKRPEVLRGTTYKLKWPATDDSFYVTINDTDEGGPRRPFEIFVASRSAAHAELLSGLTLLMSAILRRAEHPLFMVEDLEGVQSAQGAWVNGKYVPGVVALIAGVLRRHMAWLGMIEDETVKASSAPVKEVTLGETCPKCGAPALIRTDGCRKCLSCSYSECG